MIDPILGRMENGDDLSRRRDALIRDTVSLDDSQWDALYREGVARGATWIDLRQQFELIDLGALARALDDLAASHRDRYPDGENLRARLAEYEKSMEALRAAVAADQPGAWDAAAELVRFQREILLRNPLLDFRRMVVLRRRLGGEARRAMGATLGVGTLNAHTNDSLPRTGWDNEIAQLTNLRDKPDVETLYRTEGQVITDLEVDFDGSRMMFSSIGRTEANWRVFEMDLDATAAGTERRQVTPDDGQDVGHFDSCYLADPDEIIFCSTASIRGCPASIGRAQWSASIS